MKVLVLLALTATASGQVSITLQNANHAALPGSTRSVYADVEGTPNLEVKWKVTGGCTLARATTTAEPEVVTAPAVGSACTYQTKAPTNLSPSFVSATSCTVTAAAAADESKTASIVIPVCAEAVSLSTFPADTTLYKDQFGIIQTDLRGSTNTGVTWAITTNPGGAGALTGGSSNRHAVFSAKAPGTYVVTASSILDHSKKASSTIFVTAHDLPAPNRDHTESVDCTATGNGKIYEVGPARALHDLNAVPWMSLKGGDTVRIHNDDTTGASPTTYHQHVAILVGGTATQPLRVCGVPDERGNKPIIDGANATTREDEDWARGYIEDLGVISLYDSNHKWRPALDQNRNVIIEGLHIRDANASFNFIKQHTSAVTPYNSHAACVYITTGIDIVVRGNELENCSQGVFTNARTPGGSMVYNLTVEGNYLHEWGGLNNFLVHGMYLQAIGVQVQFNYFGTSVAGAIGNVIKLRSVMNFVRWNYISQPVITTARAFDMVEPQAFVCYVTPTGFAYVYHGRGYKSDCYGPSAGDNTDPLTADQVAGNYEAYLSDYVYGNIMDDGGSNVPFVHYGYDQQNASGPASDRRAGTLFYWNNTHLWRKGSGQKTIFDPTAPDIGHSYQYPVIESLNNVFAASGGGSFQWARSFLPEIIVDTNWINQGYGLPSRSSRDSYQGGTPVADLAGCSIYGQCKPGNGHLLWARNGKPGTAAASLYIGATPFATDTFIPTGAIHGLAAALPKAIQDQPSNMEYFPAINKIVPRQDQTFLGALD